MSAVDSPSAAGAAGTWRLGDLTVNRLGFGAIRLTGSLPFGEGPPRDRGQSIAVLRRAVELGVNHIDTAAFYFSPLRAANEMINAALAPYRDDLVIVTKVWPGRDPWGEWYSARPDQLRGQVEENLRQLGRDHLDVVNLRRRPRQESVAEHFGALAELRDAGLIRHLGVSDVTVGQLEEVLAIAPAVCVQNRYNIDDRTHDPVLRACTEKGIAFVPFFAVSGDRRQAGGAGTGSPELAEVARRHGATAAQVRLAWTLHQAPNVLAIPGTGNPAHLAENVAAAALRLSADDLASLNQALSLEGGCFRMRFTSFRAPLRRWWPIVGGGAHPRDDPGVQADITAQMAAAGQGRPLPVCRRADSSRPDGTRGKSEPAGARITKHTRHSNTAFTRYESAPRATAKSNR